MEEFRSVIELLVMLIVDPRTGVLFLLLAIASVSDCRTHKIPNWLTVSGAAFGLIYNAAFPSSPNAGFLWSLEGLLLGLFIMLPFYALKAMGAGDVKLMAMVGAFLGVPNTFYAVLFTFIAGGVAAVGFGLANGVLGRMLGNVKELTQNMLLLTIGGMKPDARIETGKSAGKMPYAVSITIGTAGYLVAIQLGYM